MDKKTKKRIDVLRVRLQKLRQQLAGAKQQCDDPAELAQLEEETQQTQQQLEQLAPASGAK